MYKILGLFILVMSLASVGVYAILKDVGVSETPSIIGGGVVFPVLILVVVFVMISRLFKT